MDAERVGGQRIAALRLVDELFGQSRETTWDLGTRAERCERKRRREHQAHDRRRECRAHQTLRATRSRSSSMNASTGIDGRFSSLPRSFGAIVPASASLRPATKM